MTSTRPRFGIYLVAAMAMVALAVPATANAASFSFSNAGTISVGVAPGSNPGAGSPYPSSIGLSGVTGTTLSATVTLNAVNRNFPEEMDVLLVGPQGQTVMLFSDACGLNNPNGNYTFSDAAIATLPDAGPCTAGTFKPSDFADTQFDSPAEMPAPAPVGPYGASLAAVNGTSPNGTWSLFAQDDRINDGGTISGWTLNLITLDPPPPATTAANANSALCDELRAKLKKAKKNGNKKKKKKFRKKLKNNNC